jgi:Acetyltransferase (GNAT) domain
VEYQSDPFDTSFTYAIKVTPVSRIICICGGTVVGRLPYCVTRRWGMQWCTQPELTYFLGPVVDEGTGSACTRFKRSVEITRELLLKLPPASFIQFKCHRGVGDVLAFQDQGFRTGVQFTHEIQPTPPSDLWGNIHRQKRRVILRANDEMHVCTLGDAAAFVRFYQANLDAQRLRSDMDLPVCSRIIEACIARNRGRILGAFDRSNNLAAAIFCVWDVNVFYYIMTTRRPSSHSGIVPAIIWQAIQDAASRKLIFDHGGLNVSSAIRFHAEFGGKVSQRYVVTKASLPVAIGQLLRSSAAGTWLFGYRPRLWG